jgi:hypothetical protein
MARLNQDHKEEHLEYLRELIINRFTKPIATTNDCKSLEDAIQKAIKQRLSTDTIARLFGIKKSNSSSSVFTLDIFSIYVGYTSWEGLIKSYLEQNALYQKVILFAVIQNTISLDDLFNKLNNCSKNLALYETFNQIILSKAQQKDEDFFKKLFELEFIFEFQEAYKYAIYHTIHLLGVLCEQEDWLSKIAITYYSNLPFKENYFVEWLVVPEKNYYLPLLKNCFKKDKKNTVFYHLVYCTHFAENNQWDLFLEHYNKIDIVPENNMLAMRWLGVQLYHEHQFNNKLDKDNLLVKIVQHSCTNAKDAGDRICSIFMICNYLFVIGAYECIITLFEQNANKYSTIFGYWAELNYNQLKVYYAFSLINCNQKDEARVVFNQIKPELFDLNFKQRMISIFNSLLTILQ